jgi:hypothetical protein
MIKIRSSSDVKMIIRFDLLEKVFRASSTDEDCQHTITGPLKIVDEVVHVNLKWIEYEIGEKGLKLVH